MKRLFLLSLTIILFISSNAQEIYHDLNVHIDISNQSMEVEDDIRINKSLYTDTNEVFFYIGKVFTISNAGENRAIVEIPSENPKLRKFSVLIPDTSLETSTFTLHYSAKIAAEILESESDYARGFSETDGIISEKGVYLSGSSLWVAFMENQLFTYKLTTRIDKKYGIVTQGKRTSIKPMDDNHEIIYECPFPMEEIYLVAGEWKEFELAVGNVLVQAFLRADDKDLADKYLGVTASYLKRYESLIGPYPFTKFTLVENFWETGYGMPSFTLLGEKVIRFPWILHSSYPHELLHNWWGNSVYVDYEGGNWCEGITAYMADHLNKEMQGEGEVYRRNTLQKFTDYVNAENDFPLSAFLSRNNSAQEAIGYGKSLMMYHMLRKEYGDDKFIAAFQHFYLNNKFKAASFDDIRKSFELVTGDSLALFFNQWVKRKGAPALSLEGVRVKTEGDIELVFKLVQTQAEDVFDVSVPIAVYCAGDTVAKIHRVRMTERSQRFTIACNSKPLKIEVDPYFDVMRRLDKREVPASLSRMYGSDDIAIVVPFNDRFAEPYLDLANEWKKKFSTEGKKVRILYDRDVSNLPKEKAIWIFGYGSKYTVFTNIAAEHKKTMNEDGLAVWEKMENEGSMIYVFSNPDNIDQTFAFFGVHDIAAMTPLTRKLPHYGKYSYLGFEEPHASNKLKGVFNVLDSPLFFKMKYASGTPENTASLPKQKAMID